MGSVNSLETPGRKKFDRKKLITAYILFSADVRKITMDENPGVKFGEISRIVAERWRGMTDADKQQYAERAKKVHDDLEMLLLAFISMKILNLHRRDLFSIGSVLQFLKVPSCPSN